MSAAYRVAIVGCGVIGRHHAAVIAGHPDFETTMLVDPVPGAADTVADLLRDEHAVARPAVARELDPVLAEGAPVDLVVVCTPSGTHVEIAERAVAAGLHTVIEKPLDVDLSRSRRFAELAEAAAAGGRHLSVISQHRFDPASLAVRRAVDGGRFGRITSAVASVAWWRSQDYYDSGDWRGTWALDGGGAVMNQGVHTVDLLRWFLGEPVEVHARTALLAHSGVEVEDTAVATVSFASGALAVIHATTAAYPGLSARIQVHGSAGSAIIDDDRLEYFHSAQDDLGRLADAGSVTGGAIGGNTADAEVPLEETTAGERRPDAFIASHHRQYDAIAESLRTGEQHSVSVEDALLAQALVQAVYVSSTLGRSILVADVLAGRFDTVTTRTGTLP